MNVGWAGADWPSIRVHRAQDKIVFVLESFDQIAKILHQYCRNMTTPLILNTDKWQYIYFNCHSAVFPCAHCCYPETSAIAS